MDKKAFCQTRIPAEDEDIEDEHEDIVEEDDDESEEEEADDGIDHDEVILGNTTDLILSLARSLGNEFAVPFNEKIAQPLI